MSVETLADCESGLLERLELPEAVVPPIESFKGEFKELGMVSAEDGYNFSTAVDAKVVHAVEVCIHDDYDRFKVVSRWRINETNELEPTRSDFDTTHTIGGFIPSIDPKTETKIGVGTRYSLRVVDSDWTRNDSTKTEEIPLIDPRARRILLQGSNMFSPTMNGVSEYPLSVITSCKPYIWKNEKPEIQRTDLNICELHVVTATLGMPLAPERKHLEGTYAGLATPESIAYRKKQGFNAVSMMPPQAAISEPHLQWDGRKNFWNYITAGFFALNESYAATHDPINEFREMVDSLHGAGQKVFIDVVYNHTAEGGAADPTYSYEALNRKNTYKFDKNGSGNLIDDSGCSNTLDMTKPAVVREIMDSLRYWVTEMGVDGFRFDLAGILAQGNDNIDEAPLMKAIAADEILSKVELIAEPWGATGYYSLDKFRHAKSAPWMAWNDKFRKQVQDTIKGIVEKRDLSNQLLGHDAPERTVNYVTAHDGQTLHDMAPNIAAERLALAMVMLSQGIPMRQSGSEMGYTQSGDPDAYSCGKDEPAPYVLPWNKLNDGASENKKLYEFSARLAELRNRHPIFRQMNLLIGSEVTTDGIPHPLGEKDVAWLGAFGLELTTDEWNNPDQFFGMELSGLQCGDDSFTVLINGNDSPVQAKLGRMDHPSSFGVYEKVIDTAEGFAALNLGEGLRIAEETVAVAPHSLLVLRQLAQRLPGASDSPPRIQSFSLL